ncbi:MAG: alpha/beta fold hydrolase [Pseudomonadota bacterium]
MSDFIAHSVVSGIPDAPAILLLNSMGTTTAMWRPHLALLERHFRVISMDTRGHGDSGTPEGPYSFADLVADATSVLDRHGVKTARVMGCSIGGMTAIGLGLAAPSRVARIICVAARADAPAPFKKTWDDRKTLIEAKGLDALWDDLVNLWLTPEFQAAAPDVVAEMKAAFQQTDPAGYNHLGAALKQLNYLKDLPNLRMPCLFVAGSADTAAPPHVMQDMAARIPNSRFVVIPNARHIVNVNAPAAFSNAISAFLGIDAPGMLDARGRADRGTA